MSHQTEAFEGKLAVVGLGYVGLPLAVAFSESMDVIGYDVDAQKIARYCKGEDVTTEVVMQLLRPALFILQQRKRSSGRRISSLWQFQRRSTRTIPRI